MLRFIAFRWSQNDAGASAAAVAGMRKLRSTESWMEVVRGRGFSILCTGGHRGSFRTLPVGTDSGVIFGTLFYRRWPMNRCAPEEFRFASGLAGMSRMFFRSLIRDYWGSYVALLVDAKADSLEVLRGPMGGLPCFIATSAGVTVACSYVEDCIATELFELRIDWAFVRRYVTGRADRNDTGIRGISALRPGHCASLTDNGIGRLETLWSGDSWASHANNVEHVDDELLRETTRACVGAWASIHDGILHRLSGGLDSTIVLSCLGRSYDRTRIACMNVHGHGTRLGDERAFARLAAQANGVDLHECAARGDVKLDPIVRSPRFARPLDYQGQLRRRQIEEPLVKRLGVSAVFGGTGGDQVFYQRSVLLAVADLISDCGMTGRLWSYIQAVARNQRLSTWQVLRGAMRRQREASPPPGTSLVSRQALTETAHNTENQPLKCSLPPGKRAHVQSCMISSVPYSSVGMQATAEPVLPLLSQPLVELSLGIPTYMLAAEGIERGMARRAFSDEIPPAIARRTRKGATDAHLQQLLAHNLSFVRQFLLDGTLVKEGLLDRGRLKQALTPASAAAGMLAGEVICRHLNTEVWLQSWLRANHKLMRSAI